MLRGFSGRLLFIKYSGIPENSRLIRRLGGRRCVNPEIGLTSLTDCSLSTSTAELDCLSFWSSPYFFHGRRLPIFVIPGLLLGAVGGYLGQVYMKAQLSVKREMSNAKAPVLGHFGAAIAGLGKGDYYYHRILLIFPL